MARTRMRYSAPGVEAGDEQLLRIAEAGRRFARDRDTAAGAEQGVLRFVVFGVADGFEHGSSTGRWHPDGCHGCLVW
jgi:hypothetical protein